MINAPRADPRPFFAESLSDTDEDISHQNMSNAFLHIVTSYHIGTTLELCLTEEELGRVGLSCHFAVDCLCDNWYMFSEPKRQPMNA